MLILLLFSFLAGIVTVLSPCVLPVLPALLSAGAGQGRLRPFGIILGLIASFTFFTLALTAIVRATGISPDVLRYAAILLIAGFGLVLVFPLLGERFAEAASWIANLGQSVQEKSRLFGTGFWSGFVLGIALGLVWTPCAGPILASITTLVQTTQISAETFAITVAYSLGAAIPMFTIIYGSSKVVSSSRALSKYSEEIRKGFGSLMILAAFAIAFHWDVAFQQAALEYVPMVNVEDNPLVKKELESLRKSSQGNSSFADALSRASAEEKRKDLPKIATAPEIVGILGWINSTSLTLESLRGKVVLIDFWTYSCINCIRTFPYLKEWDRKYKDQGLVIIGIHTPEFEFEKNADNVKDAVKRFGISYPVALDSNFATWQNYSNLYWPAHYLIDQAGILRQFHFGEGKYKETENAIRSLIGLPLLKLEEQTAAARPLTPETYLGYARGTSYALDIVLKPDRIADYTFKEPMGNNRVAIQGKWRVDEEKIIAIGNSTLTLNFIATRVYLVMSSGNPATVKVLLDGKPLPKKYYSVDQNRKGEIEVEAPRKYDVLTLKGDYSRHTLTLIVPRGVSLYAFTFGDE